MTIEPPTPPKQPPKPDLFTGGKRKPDDQKPEDKDNLLSFFKENSKETFVYVFLILSLLFLFFDSTSMYGSLFIGILFGLYFIDELSSIFKNVNEFLSTYGLMKTLVLGGTLVALLIKAPFLVIGVAVVIFFKIVLLPENIK